MSHILHPPVSLFFTLLTHALGPIVYILQIQQQGLRAMLEQNSNY